MPRCFVIPLFDSGPYDKRFKDVLLPAIEAANLEAYHADQDPSSSIPIDDIENNILSLEKTYPGKAALFLGSLTMLH